MPFLKGRGALRRTRQWLEKGEIVLRPNIETVLFGYCKSGRWPHHEGLEKFMFWHLPQLRYKNSHVQFVSFKYLTPTPWIQVFYDDDRTMVVDCESRSRQDIHDHFKEMFGKSKEVLDAEEDARAAQTANPANFGPDFSRQCMCVLPGQVPCPAFKELPKSMQGKWTFKLRAGQMTAEELAEEDRKLAEACKNS